MTSRRRSGSSLRSRMMRKIRSVDRTKSKIVACLKRGREKSVKSGKSAKGVCRGSESCESKREQLMKGEKSTRGRAAESFEDLHVYQRARELAGKIYEVTKATQLAADHNLVDQMR